MYGPGVPFFDIFSVLVPAGLFLGALYVAFAIFQGRSSGDAESSADVTSSVLRIVYTLALAGLIAGFVGFGIEAFYPSPKYPGEGEFYGEMYGGGEATVEGGITMGSTEGAMAQEVPPEEFAEPGMSPEMIESERAFMQQERAYQRELSEHRRIASLIAVGAAALLLVVGWVPFLRRLPVIGDGLTLGGLLTLIYGLALGIQVDSNLFRFLVVSAGLVVLLVAIALKLRSGDLQNA
jgi:hypothetical protein